MGMTPQQYRALTERLNGRRSSTAVSRSVPVRSMAYESERILGIDPSLRGTGYGIIQIRKARTDPIAYGTIAVSAKWPRSRCLMEIAGTLQAVITQHQPTVCAIEGLFYAQNLKTALTLGEARGVCLLQAARANLIIYEIAPRKVKQAIVGYGAAQKTAVAKMVQRLLALVELPSADAADALALALTYAQESRCVSGVLLKTV